jgi:hypothetical protein
MRLAWSSSVLLLSMCWVACGDDDANTTPNPDAGASSLCAKYGGAGVIKGAITQHVIPTIAADCRVNGFFASLSNDQLTRLSDCLSIQAQELFGCEGITYAGAQASNGLVCRSMTAAHAGMGISGGDFDALIEDVVTGLGAAGVEQDDIGAAAPALLGMKEDITETSDEQPSAPMCSDDDGGA